ASDRCEERGPAPVTTRKSVKLLAASVSLKEQHDGASCGTPDPALGRLTRSRTYRVWPDAAFAPLVYRCRCHTPNVQGIWPGRGVVASSDPGLSLSSVAWSVAAQWCAVRTAVAVSVHDTCFRLLAGDHTQLR